MKRAEKVWQEVKQLTARLGLCRCTAGQKIENM